MATVWVLSIGIIDGCYRAGDGAWPVTSASIHRYPCDVDEAALIEAAKTDLDAFAGLYDGTVREVYRFAFSLTRDHGRAEDVTAEAYGRALSQLDRYEDRGRPFVAWLFTITRNLVRDGVRRASRETALLDHDARVDAWPGEGLLRDERREALERALRRLAPLQRRVIVLRYGHEQSCREVGEQIRKSETAVKQLSYRAVCALRKALREDGFGDEID